MPDFLHYQVLYKTRAWGEAITEGFSARVAHPGRAQLGRGYVHIVAGLQFGALETLKAIRASGEPYIFVDRAYFGGGSKSGRMRMTWGAYQQHTVRPAASARDWGVTLQPWRTDGEFVMVVPPSPEIERLFGFHWQHDWTPRIRAATGREIVISHKKDRDKSPIADRLQGCYAVVTWTSNVAVDAICAGIPAWTHRESAAAPVSAPLSNIDIGLSVPRRVDREAWFASLTHSQFTVEEVASGFARDAILESACATA